MLRYHEIAETNHRILNAFSLEKLRTLGEAIRVAPGARMLDLACGKAEMLCRWAEWFGVRGDGVDISAVFVAAAEARAQELGVADRVTIIRRDATAYEPEPAAYDLVSCIGATWIGDGLEGTIRLLAPAMKPGGLMLIGEPYWIDPPPAEAYAATGVEEGEYTSLAGTLARIEGAGMTLVEMVVADGDSWDRYVAAQWLTLEDWLRANPGDPDAAAIRARLDRSRRAYMAFERRYFGWGVFVMRAAQLEG